MSRTTETFCSRTRSRSFPGFRFFIRTRLSFHLYLDLIFEELGYALYQRWLRKRRRNRFEDYGRL